jgi:hypothetical protein
MKKIIFDTNFATIPFQFKVDIYSELNRLIDEQYKIFFPNLCVTELKRLKFGKTALDLMEKKNVVLVDIPLTKNVDDSIANYAETEKAMIATQDRELKKKALKKGLAIITLRKKQFLIITGGGNK